MADPSTILAILQFVDTAAMAVCLAVDKAIEFEHKDQHALKELRKALDNLTSETLVYKGHLNAMMNDTNRSGRSPCTRFIQRYVMGYSQAYIYAYRANHLHNHRQDGKEAMESLERALKVTRLVLEENPAGNRREVTVYPAGNKKPRRALNFVLNVLKANSRLGHRQELISNLKAVTYEILVCRQNNERAFKLVRILYVVAQQWTDSHDTQERVGQAIASILLTFHSHPFAVSPEGDSRVNLNTYAVLNYNPEIATQHKALARLVSKVWVDGRIPKYGPQVRDIDALQTSLFELLLGGTVPQLKRHGAYSSDDPERPEFKRSVEGLERTLQESITRSRKQRFVFAFCGTVKAGKSLFLNALMGRAILPSDGEPMIPARSIIYLVSLQSFLLQFGHAVFAMLNTRRFLD